MILNLRIKTLADNSMVNMVLLVIAVLLASGGPSLSQSKRPTLTVGWVLSPPLWNREESGEKSGFFIEFARLIADELDHELIIKEYRTTAEIGLAQNTGETDMMAGATAFDAFKPDNLFSNPVGRTQSRTYVHVDHASDWDVNSVSGEMIGIVGQTLTPEVNTLLERNVAVFSPSLGSGVMGVLSGDFAAFVYPEEAASFLLHEARIDHLVVPVGEPLSKLDRVVVLHRSRADLLDPINSAIERMKTDGKLAELFTENRVEIYDPAPEVLTVAFPDIDAATGESSRLAPSYVLNEAGEPSGYSIEIFRGVADRAGLTYEFKFVAPTLMVQGPAAAGVDIIPTLGISPARAQIMDQSLPAGGIEFSATIRREDAEEISTPADLAGRTVGVIAGSFADVQAQRDPTLAVVGFDTPREQLVALLERRIDAALLLRQHLSNFAEHAGDGAKVTELEQAVFTADRAISLRFGLGEVREKLNDELPRYLLSEEFAELREKYFAVPVFWTEARRRNLTAALIGLGFLVFALGIAFLASERARRREKHANENAMVARREADELSSRLQAVMAASSNGLVALDRDGKVAMMNPRARDLLDVQEDFDGPQDLGRSYFTDTEDGAPLEGEDFPIRRSMKNSKLDGVLYQFHGENAKRPKHIRISSSAIPLDASSEIGTVIVLNDVTEYERQRKESLRNGRMSAIGQLTGGVAHDFNNLLAVIMGNLELMKDAKVDPAHSEMIDAGLAATKRGADLTKNLLAFSRQSRLEVEILDLNCVVLDAQSWMRRALPESISVETSLLANAWPVQLDRSSLESALLNLIVNARDAMGGFGNLTIETANLRIDEDYVDSRDEELAVGRYVLLAVSDTGTGISRQNLDLLFEPYFTTKAPGSGSGVGLSMVQGFVKQSGGTVQVYSELGMGTTFKLYFPAFSGEVPPESTLETVGLANVEGHARILLTEDDANVRHVLETILKGARYTVVTANSGDAALELFHSEPKFDLLVTDIVMPGKLQGTVLAKEVRILQPSLPIIFLSGYAVEATVHGNGLQPEDVRLMKPVARQDLLNAVSHRLAETRN